MNKENKTTLVRLDKKVDEDLKKLCEELSFTKGTLINFLIRFYREKKVE